MDSTQRTRPRTGGSPVPLVIFIITTVVFAVLSYWGLASYQSQADAARKADDAKKAAEATLKKSQDMIEAFKTVSGAETADALKPHVSNLLESARNEGFGAGVQEETAKDALTTGLYALSQQKIALDSLNSSLAAEVGARKNVEEQRKAEGAAYQKAIAEKSEEIKTLQKEKEDQKDTLQAKILQEATAREALRDQYYTDKDGWDVKETKLGIKILELQTRLREYAGEDVVLGEANGRVANIDLRSGLVAVNIGAKAGVRRGMRFVAFSKDAAGKPIKKGVIEVEKVTENACAGRIVSEEKGLKVGKDDYVYNLAGLPRKLFVFAGTPKEYESEMWANFIRADGGEVVDQISKGDQVADYLVLCTYDEKDLKTRDLINEAREFTVRMIKEGDLKRLMGLK